MIKLFDYELAVRVLSKLGYLECIEKLMSLFLLIKDVAEELGVKAGELTPDQLKQIENLSKKGYNDAKKIAEIMNPPKIKP
ncbi:hypothetical protein [Acidovorax sp. SUPP3334]|uniref:hypothetical protein n=1 Tax=Acidovorax sp. SUPP3334 TaxID=2920881 RepID=UPI0023DE57F7|nr:hypothetical protein [Acidovorax sp. SUPP3334]GKT26749.1 hypothetical protein AVHM3334_21900 [Acidovorax sp. SUPP3334]